MTSRGSFLFGVKEFDERFSKALQPGTTIAIVGTPGTGKTTFAATICYANAKQGRPCIYLSTQEPKDKFYNIMKNLGMNFEELEKEGLFKFVNMPLLTTSTLRHEFSVDINESLFLPTSLESAKIFMETIETLVNEDYVRVLVIDSISPLLRVFSENIKERAYLQNYLYNLARIINGLLVLTVEYSHSPMLRDVTVDVEYVADIVIKMVQKTVRGMLERSMRLLKIRGSPIISSEIPFALRENKGIVAFLPPLIKDIHVSKETLKWPCSILGKILYEIPKNYTIYIGYNTKTSFKIFLSLLLSLMKVNNLEKGLIINYSYPPEFFNNLLVKSLTLVGIEKEKAKTLINRFFTIETINPLISSLYEIFSTEINLIEQYNPDVTVFWNVQVPTLLHAAKDIGKYATVLKNQILILKKHDILTIRLGRITTTRQLNMNTEVSDLVFKHYYDVTNPSNSYVIVEGPSIDTTRISGKELQQCILECKKVLSS